jgi:translation initiation factor 1
MKKKLFSGLPEDLEESLKSISEETQKLIVRTDKRSYGKIVTIIEGIEPGIAKDTLKKLKSILGCGGTYKEGRIELQGDHIDKIKRVLVEIGFREENIEVSKD